MVRGRRNEAEAEKVEMFFLRLAYKNHLCLRAHGGSQGDFVFKPVNSDGFESEQRWMSADLTDKTANAVRLDDNCGADEIHKVLLEMGVPHEFEKRGTQSEVRLTLRNAQKLEEAYAQWTDKIKRRWKDSVAVADGLGESHSHRRG